MEDVTSSSKNLEYIRLPSPVRHALAVNFLNSARVPQSKWLRQPFPTREVISLVQSQRGCVLHRIPYLEEA